jgi:hypothetical protein
MEMQGRAGLVALRRSGGGAGALGRGFYKGGFEPKMTRKEAALILEMPYVRLPLSTLRLGVRRSEYPSRETQRLISVQ